MASSNRKTKIAIVGLILSCLGGLSVVISMCTPNWIESIQSRQTGFGKLGIWEACFSDYVNEKDSLGKRYNGCHGLYSFEYRSIYKWLSPTWLMAIQGLMTFTLAFMVAAVVIWLLYFIRCCHRDSEANLIMIGCIVNFAAGAFSGISVIMFGIMADTDRQWLPHPDSNFLSWSFGFGVLAAFLALFAGMCILVEFLRLKAEKENRERRTNILMASKPVSRY